MSHYARLKTNVHYCIWAWQTFWNDTALNYVTWCDIQLLLFLTIGGPEMINEGSVVVFLLFFRRKAQVYYKAKHYYNHYPNGANLNISKYMNVPSIYILESLSPFLSLLI